MRGAGRHARRQDVPTHASLEEVESEIREAIESHLDGMREDGQPIPIPQSKIDNVEVGMTSETAR
jgi:hypothetical protein